MLIVIALIMQRYNTCSKHGEYCEYPSKYYSYNITIVL